MTGSGPLTVAAVGAVIRAYRKASGLSQKDLAKLGGVSRATLNYLESGREDMEIGASRLFALLAV
ncbi:MAG: helix-turn-helix transcriptional regulator, partial [Candidatus Nanopelagicales bacterium]